MTTIMRRQPVGLEISDWINRLLDDRFLPDRTFGTFGEKDVLRVEEFVQDDVLVVRAEMPGIDPDKDVEISVHDGLLHIRAERHSSSEEEGRTSYRSEFRYGLLDRTLPLPPGVGGDDVKATYKDGILEVRMPLPKDTQKAYVPVIRLP